MVEELRGLADELGEMTRRNEAFAVEVGMLRERTAVQAEMIDALRAQLERLTARETTVEAPPAVPEAPAAAESPTDTPAPSAGLWQRLRAVLLGHCSPRAPAHRFRPHTL